MENENIKQMREQHKKEIQELLVLLSKLHYPIMDNCKHIKISECMPYMWAPGHIGHCVKVCEFCGKSIYTTYEGIPSFNEEGKPTIIKTTPLKELFGCPERKNCHYYGLLR